MPLKKSKMTKSILITGGLGFIGSSLANEILRKNLASKCILLDNFGGHINPLKKNYQDFRQLRLKDNKKIIIERGGAENFSIVLKLIDKYKPEYIYHTAALPLAKVDNLNAMETSIGSIDATRNIIDNLSYVISKNKDYKFKRFTYFSSSMVYGDFKKKQVTENEITRPKEIYGTMKLAGEIITEGLCNFYNIPFTIVRPSAVYGPTDMNQRVSQIFIEKAINKEEIKINGKDEKLDFTYIEDLVNGVILASTREKGNGEIFNITCGKGRILVDFVKCIQKEYKDLTFKFTKRDKFRPIRGTLSVEKAKKLLNFKPKYTLEMGVAKYLDYIKTINNK